jgi:hypothetical protein
MPFCHAKIGLQLPTQRPAFVLFKQPYTVHFWIPLNHLSLPEENCNYVSLR